MVFLVLLEKMIFLFPENMILPLRWKMKDDLSQKKKKKKKNTRKYDIFFKRSEKIVFSKSASGNCLSCIIWKDGIFSRARYIFSLGGK